MPPPQQKNPYPAYDEEWGWLLDRWDNGPPAGTKLLAKSSKGILSRPRGDKGWVNLRNYRGDVILDTSKRVKVPITQWDTTSVYAALAGKPNGSQQPPKPKPAKKVHPDDLRSASGF